MTLTTDVNKVLKALQQLEPKGHINMISGLRIAHVSTKYRGAKDIVERGEEKWGTGEVLFTATLRPLLQLALKHRQNKNQKIRIIAFIGSPLDVDHKEVGVGLEMGFILCHLFLLACVMQCLYFSLSYALLL